MGHSQSCPIETQEPWFELPNLKHQIILEPTNPVKGGGYAVVYSGTWKDKQKEKVIVFPSQNAAVRLMNNFRWRSKLCVYRTCWMRIRRKKL
jgi:hypothetical protein